MLTFNPGLTNRIERIESFTDVRDAQAKLEAAGLALETQVAADTSARDRST